MFLMFGLLRPNVLPLDDLGLQRAICLNYFRGRSVSLRTMRKIARVGTLAFGRNLVSVAQPRSIPVEY